MAKEDSNTPDQTEETGDEQELATEQGSSQDVEDDEEGEKDEVADNLKSRMELSKRNRREYFNEWKRSVELRLGKIASQYTGGVSVQDEVQTEVNPDWYLTKTKTANLFSQVPEVRGTSENDMFAPAVPAFMKSMNFELSEKRMNLMSAIEEELNDVVNAAGVGGVLIGWAARFQDKEIPAIDLKALPPDVVQQLQAAGKIPMKTVPEVVSSRMYGSRISPTDLLWPAEFAGSDFNDADFVGNSGRMPWGMAKGELRLKDEQKDKVLGTSEIKTEDTLRAVPNKSTNDAAKVVKYDQLWYWRYRYDPECKHFDEIWRIVWVDGLDKPVIHEPYKGQEFVQEVGQYIGVRIFPLQILTLTYVSDNCIPPSDSSAARPQINDMRRSRSMMFQQRERAIPVRWYDVNRIDPLIADTLMRGQVQGMIPTNGDGTRSIGEIARASYPNEDLSFDQMNKQDLMDMWQLTPEQLGQKIQRQNKQQTQMFQQGTASRLGQERGKVAAHFLRLCAVLAGLMVLFGQFPNLTPQEKEQLQKVWDMKHVACDIAFKILPDSTITLDTDQRLQKLSQFLNMTAKSGFVNPKPIIIEMAELSGIDPGKVIVDPKPKDPEEPNFSYRASGKEDLMNPIVIAMLLKGKRLDPQMLDDAKKLLASLDQPPAPPQPAGPGQPGQPAPPPPAGPGRPPGPPANPALQPGGANAHPEWSLASKIAKRSRDMGGNS